MELSGDPGHIHHRLQMGLFVISHLVLRKAHRHGNAYGKKDQKDSVLRLTDQGPAKDQDPGKAETHRQHEKAEIGIEVKPVDHLKVRKGDPGKVIGRPFPLSFLLGRASAVVKISGLHCPDRHRLHPLPKGQVLPGQGRGILIVYHIAGLFPCSLLPGI